MTPPADPFDADPRVGWLAHEVADDYPELRVVEQEIPVRYERRSPAWVRERLGALSARVYGAQALRLREQEIPAAHRIFWRQVGLDPDVDRTPVEAAMLERLKHGSYKSVGMPQDALTIALVETAVPLYAVDAGVVDGPLGIRLSTDGEPLGTGPLAGSLPPGRLVVADADRPMCELFRPAAPGFEVTTKSARVRLFAVQVPGVSRIHVEEALWTCTTLLELD